MGGEPPCLREEIREVGIGEPGRLERRPVHPAIVDKELLAWLNVPQRYNLARTGRKQAAGQVAVGVCYWIRSALPVGKLATRQCDASLQLSYKCGKHKLS